MTDGHQKQMENMKKANEQKLKDEKGNAEKELHKLNEDALYWKKENERNLKEVKKIYGYGNTVPSNGQASFESGATTQGGKQPSFESASTTANKTQVIITQRTETAQNWQQDDERIQRELKAFKDEKFRNRILDAISISSAALGAALCAAFPPAAPIIAPAAALISLFAVVNKTDNNGSG